jgi:hypothetical protein
MICGAVQQAMARKSGGAVQPGLASALNSVTP